MNFIEIENTTNHIDIFLFLAYLHQHFVLMDHTVQSITLYRWLIEALWIPILTRILCFADRMARKINRRTITKFSYFFITCLNYC